MHPFTAYLQQYHLEALTVSVVAQVRYITVWNATRGNPIKDEYAKRIRQAVVKLTGVPYIGPLTLIEPGPVDQLPTLPIKKIPWRNLFH
jgi:hypothetical protein